MESMTQRTAHVDTFARDRLPPTDQWPRLHFDLPELRYPERSIARPSCLTMQSPKAMASGRQY